MVFAQRRSDAMQLERAALKHHTRWRVDAPSGPVMYVDGVPSCFAPVRWSAGGRNEWLDRDAYLMFWISCFVRTNVLHGRSSQLQTG